MTARYHDLPGAPDEGAGNPGRRLREARTAARLSLDDIALRLRLDRRTVDALERDDYAGLPEPTFVRGYLRNYARLLELPPGPIVEAYDRLGYTPPDLVADISSRPEVRSTDMPMRLVTYAVAGVLVTLGVIWWQSERGPGPISLDRAGEMVAPGPDRVDAVAPAPAATDSPKPSTSPAPGVGTAAIPAQPAPPAGQTPLASRPVAAVAAPARPTDPRSAPASPAVPASTPAPSVPVPAASGPASSTPAPAPPAPSPATPVQGGSDRLVLRLKHDSWVEVYDRGGKRVFFNLAKAGQALSLTGTPPFRVILGYARDAQVEYNGQPFDPAPYTAKDIARFSVGG